MAVRMSHHLLSVTSQLRLEPTAKRVRCMVDGTTVADTSGAVLVWEPRRVVPMYAVPADDFRAELVALPSPAVDLTGLPEMLGPEDFALHTCPGQAYTVRSGGRDLVAAAFRPHDPALADHLVLDFSAFDWWEEDEQVTGHPHDPFKRIDILASDRSVSLALNGVTLASSGRALALFETHLPIRWYLPRDDVRMDLLSRSNTRTTCAYKGHASYFSLPEAGRSGRDLAWTYEEPLPEATRLRGRIAFFTERVDLTLDGVPADRPVTFWSGPGD